MREPGFILGALLLVGAVGVAQALKTGEAAENRYPNELLQFRFYQAASWRSLEPSVSNMKDVRRVLGDPQEASDVSQYTKPYPGDEKAEKPVFTYKVNKDWETLVYFAKYCFHVQPKDIPGDRLCSIDLIPTKRIPFDSTQLPAVFQKRHVWGADAAWNEYSDGTGLRYDVYTTHTPYGNMQPGDLQRISYGPPDGGKQNQN